MSLIISAFHPKALNVVTETGRSSGLSVHFTFPSFLKNSGVREVAERCLSFKEVMRAAFTATGIAPEFNRIPF